MCRFPACSLALLTVLLCAGRPLRAATIDGIAATVNGEVITLLDLEKAGRPLVEQRLRGVLRRERPKVRREVLLTVLDGLIMRELQLQRARQLGVRVTDAEVDRAIERIRESNSLTEEMFARALAEKGITLETYRSQISDQITFSKLMQQEIRARVAVTPEDIAASYEENKQEYFQPERIRVRHLLVKVDESGGEDAVRDARRRAIGILEEFEGGAEFSELVAQYSPETAAGDTETLEWLERGEFLRELEDVAFALPEGKVSDPIRSRAGFHLLQVVAKEEAAHMSLETVSDTIREKLTQRKMEEGYQVWLKKLREESQIEILY